MKEEGSPSNNLLASSPLAVVANLANPEFPDRQRFAYQLGVNRFSHVLKLNAHPLPGFLPFEPRPSVSLRIELPTWFTGSN